VENGRVVLQYTTREADLGYRHIIHGGIAIALLDEVMTWAAIIFVRQACVAAEITTRLKMPIRLGETIKAVGEVHGGKPRLMLTKGQVLNKKGEELVSAVGKYVPMASDQVSLCSKDFVVSPEAIDPDLLLGKDSSKP